MRAKAAAVCAALLTGCGTPLNYQLVRKGPHALLIPPSSQSGIAFSRPWRISTMPSTLASRADGREAKVEGIVEIRHGRLKAIPDCDDGGMSSACGPFRTNW